jgi:hypothetical protein
MWSCTSEITKAGYPRVVNKSPDRRRREIPDIEGLPAIGERHDLRATNRCLGLLHEQPCAAARRLDPGARHSWRR